jgi:ribosomal protein S18 acetylase RimI-like enzyme
VRQAIVPSTARAQVRDWPLDPTIGHLVLLDVGMVPDADQVTEWVRTAYDNTDDSRPPRTALRTGAMYSAAAAVFMRAGFEVVDRLALLQRTIERDGPRPPRPDGVATLRRGRKRDLAALARVDQTSFPAGWRNDAESLDEIASATPRARTAIAQLGRPRETVGFALTGLAGTTGYLQRLAVSPDARRNGIGRQLVDDAVAWLTRRGAARALVNTGIDNPDAQRLYEAAAFRLLDDQLVVLEHRRTP